MAREKCGLRQSGGPPIARAGVLLGRGTKKAGNRGAHSVPVGCANPNSYRPRRVAHPCNSSHPLPRGRSACLANSPGGPWILCSFLVTARRSTQPNRSSKTRHAPGRIMAGARAIMARASRISSGNSRQSSRLAGSPCTQNFASSCARSSQRRCRRRGASSYRQACCDFSGPRHASDSQSLQNSCRAMTTQSLYSGVFLLSLNENE